MESPVIKAKKGISPIWILPLVALLLGGYLVYKDYKNAGVMITVRIQNATGLTPGKTEVFFKGIPVGKLKGFAVTPDLLHIDAKIEMVKESKEELTSNTKFWVVRPEVSMNRITGLDTLVKGSYFEVIPGDPTEKATKFFKALPEAPPISSSAPGLHITLTYSNSISLSPGSPILYKKIEIGEVVSKNLESDSSTTLKILVYPNFKQFIKSNSLFFLSSGIHLEANLPNISLKFDPIKAILQGGINVETPEGGKPIVSNEKTFHLFADHDEIKHLDDIEIKLQLTVDNVVKVGSEIRFQGVKVGSVAKLVLQKDLKSIEATAHVNKMIMRMLRSGSYLWIVKPQLGLAAISNLETIIQGSYINILPGGGEPIKSFTVHSQRPTNMLVQSGLNLVLETDRLGSLGYNKPVYYRQVQVGHTTGYELSDTGQTVLVYLNIREKYADLIRENTKFWNTSGVRIQGGLMTSMKISTESLAAMLDGGITFNTPEGDAMGSGVDDSHHFTLYSDPDDKWLNWSPAISLGKVAGKKEGQKKVEKKAKKMNRKDKKKKKKKDALQSEDLYFDYL